MRNLLFATTLVVLAVMAALPPTAAAQAYPAGAGCVAHPVGVAARPQPYSYPVANLGWVPAVEPTPWGPAVGYFPTAQVGVAFGVALRPVPVGEIVCATRTLLYGP